MEIFTIVICMKPRASQKSGAREEKKGWEGLRKGLRNMCRNN